MTPTFAIDPLQPVEFEPVPGENWTVPTTMYWSTLECKIAGLANATLTYGNRSNDPLPFFTNGVDWSLEPGGRITNHSVSEDLYGPAFYNINVTSSLYPSRRGADDEIEVSRPTSTTEQLFFVLYQYLTNESNPDYTIYPNNAHPIFCTPEYWSAPVETVISLESNRSTVANWTMLGPRRPLTFNTTLLHMLWTYGVFEKEDVLIDEVNPLNALPMPLGYFNTSQLYRGEQSAIHSTNWAGGARLENVASWVFARAHGNYEGLLDNSNPLLRDTFNSTLNNLFAFAMQNVLQDRDPALVSHVEGRKQVVKLAVVIDPILSRLLEGALGVLVLCGLATLIFSRPRYQPSNLSSDPDSLGSTMSFVADGQGLTGPEVINKRTLFSLNLSRHGLLSINCTKETSASSSNPSDGASMADNIPKQRMDSFADTFEEQRNAFHRPLEFFIPW